MESGFLQRAVIHTVGGKRKGLQYDEKGGSPMGKRIIAAGLLLVFLLTIFVKYFWKSDMINKKNKIIYLACLIISIILMVSSIFIKLTTKLPFDVPIRESIEIYHLLLFSDFIFNAAIVILGVVAAYIVWVKGKNIR